MHFHHIRTRAELFQEHDENHPQKIKSILFRKRAQKTRKPLVYNNVKSANLFLRVPSNKLIFLLVGYISIT